MYTLKQSSDYLCVTELRWHTACNNVTFFFQNVQGHSVPPLNFTFCSTTAE
jgi:hypothetical protein